MSPKRRIQTEVSETDDQGGLKQRMSLRWKVEMVRDVSETEVPDGCPRDGGS